VRRGPCIPGDLKKGLILHFLLRGGKPVLTEREKNSSGLSGGEGRISLGLRGSLRGSPEEWLFLRREI